MAIKGKNRTLKKIVKRDGRIEKFDSKKIANAITKAGKVTGEFNEKQAKELTVKALYLAQQTLTDNIPTVEDVANIVEEVLMNSFKATAKAFILYRDQQQRLSEFTASEQIKLVNAYIKRKDWQVNENANTGYSLSGLSGYISSEISKKYWLNHLYPQDIREAHNKGDFHIHDLGILGSYCAGWNLIDILSSGFGGVVSKVESQPPKHFRTALHQIVNFIFTLQNEVAGAQALSNVDTLLAPFIHYDKLSYKEIKQCLQEFIFNLNVSTRQSFQSPFSNITLDLTVGETYKDEAVVLGGKLLDTTYKEFQKEMDLFNKALFEVMMEGDGKGRIFTFPVVTVNITKDFNWDNPILDKFWEATAKYGFPYFANYVNSDLDPKDIKSLCCRLSLDLTQLKHKGGSLFGAGALTGSIGVVTLNLPKLAYFSKDEKDFFEKLQHIMVLAKESLVIKRKIIEEFTDQGLYPYCRHYLKGIKQRLGGYWKNHFSTIGLVGANEACLNLFGEDLGTTKGIKFAQDILDFMRKIALDFQKETGDNFNIEQTPAEATSYSLALKNKKIDKKILCANEEEYRKGAPPYLSNSTNLPVNYSDDIFEILDIQNQILPKYNGGSVIHVFLGEAVEDIQILKKFVKVICTKYNIPYFSITPSFSICPVHGYLQGVHHYCPKCDIEILEKTKESINE